MKSMPRGTHLKDPVDQGRGSHFHESDCGEAHQVPMAATDLGPTTRKVHALGAENWSGTDWGSSLHRSQ
jgi:hypothetical protein